MKVREWAYLGNVDTGPEELQMLPHLAGLVLGVEDSQLGEHAHVSPLQTECGLHERDELAEVALVLVEADQLLQLIGVHYDVQATHLRQTELLRLHTREAHLEGGREGGRGGGGGSY